MSSVSPVSTEGRRFRALDQLPAGREAFAPLLALGGWATGLWLLHGPTNGYALGLACCQGLVLLLTPGFSGPARGDRPLGRDPLFHAVVITLWALACWRLMIQAGSSLLSVPGLSLGPNWFLAQSWPKAFLVVFAGCLLSLTSLPSWRSASPPKALQPWVIGSGLALLAAFCWFRSGGALGAGAGMLVLGSALFLMIRTLNRSWLGALAALVISAAAAWLPVAVSLTDASPAAEGASPAWLLLPGVAALAAVTLALPGRRPARSSVAFCGALWVLALGCEAWAVSRPPTGALASLGSWLALELAGTLFIARRERLKGILPELARHTAVACLAALVAMAVQQLSV